MCNFPYGWKPSFLFLIKEMSMSDSNKSLRKEFVAVACTDSNGGPEIICYEVEVKQALYDLGEHYVNAEELAKADDYEGTFKCFDNSEHCFILSAAKAILEWREREGMPIPISLDKIDKATQTLSRNEIMNFMRSDDWVTLTNDDRMEIFMQMPVSGEDLTVDLFNELLSDYDSPLRVQPAVEDKGSEDEASKRVEILLHDISYWYENGMDITDTDMEEIAYKITQGFREGELNGHLEVGDEEPVHNIRGWWKIAK